MSGRLLRTHRGQSIVEYAIGLNVLLLLTLGVADLGRAVWMSNSLSYLAREGTRYGAISSRTTTQVQSYVVSRAHQLAIDGIIVTLPIRCNKTIGADTVTMTHVSVRAPFESVTGLIGGIWRNGPMLLDASSQMYVEGTFNQPLAGVTTVCP